jgi:predicted CoA-binding protein
VALRQHGHTPLPVAPGTAEIEGIPVVSRLNDLGGHIDTLTMYVGPKISDQLTEEIVALRPGRVIFNPGSENPRLAARLSDAAIPHEDACTLVLLSTGQF